MRRNGGKAAKAGRTRFAALGARLSLLAVCFALVSQILSFGAQAAGGLRGEAARLQALLGGPVLICVQKDDSSPHDSAACHAGCPLCRLAGDLATLAPPAAAPTLAPPAVVARLKSIPAAAPEWAEAGGFSLARGPPVAS